MIGYWSYFIFYYVGSKFGRDKIGDRDLSEIRNK